MNKRVVSIALLLFVCLSVSIVPMGVVNAENRSPSVSLTQVSPSSSGVVGQSVYVQGFIATLNGSFQILFDQNIVATGLSNSYSIAISFNVPEVSRGTYPLTLRDLSTLANSTKQFQVTTGYTINSISSQIQERGSVNLNITVTGGLPNTQYNANVTIILPSPLNSTYSKIVPLGTSSEKGTANALLSYPDSSFQPAGSLTDYSGSYIAYFNQSENLAKNTFSVGFLDSSTYHRGQTATIKAVGYQPNQSANLVVTSAIGTLLDQKALTASADGTMTASWQVPSNAAVGTYIVQINPFGNSKAVLDSQGFSINGYSVQIKTVNLANDIAPLIRLQVIDTATNAVANASSGNDGVANFSLEAGTQSLTAFWNGVVVGQTNITVSEAGVFTIVCTLTNLKIAVQNEDGIPMPFVNIDIGFRYQTTSGVTQIGIASGQTDILGFYWLNSTLTNIDYSVNASLYSRIFAVSSVNKVAEQPFFVASITCPNEPLTINVIGNSHTVIAGARVELVEVSNSLFYTATTDSDGSIASQVTFGSYRLRIYKDNILINQTNIDVFSDTQKQIQCTQYGIQVTAVVLDLLGQPIPKANVTLLGQATQRFSELTQNNGKAIFNDVIGGEMQVIAFAQGAPNDFQSITQIVNQPITIQVKLDKYVALGPILIQANTLLTISIILSLIIAFGVVEVYRRKKH